MNIDDHVWTQQLRRLLFEPNPADDGEMHKARVKEIIAQQMFFNKNLPLKQPLSLKGTAVLHRNIIVARNALPDFTARTTETCQAFFIFLFSMGEVLKVNCINTYGDLLGKLKQRYGPVEVSPQVKELLGKCIMLCATMMNTVTDFSDQRAQFVCLFTQRFSMFCSDFVGKDVAPADLNLNPQDPDIQHLGSSLEACFALLPGEDRRGGFYYRAPQSNN